MRIFACVAAALVLCCQHAKAIDDTPAHFTLRDGEARSGPHIRRDAPAGGVAPNRRYAELSAQDKRALRAAYDSMAADDEPPFPANGMARLHKAMRDGLGRRAQQGPLRLVVRVDSRGDASAVEILHSPGDKASKLAATLLMAEKYKPGLCHGVPCTMEFPFSAQFTRMR